MSPARASAGKRPAADFPISSALNARAIDARTSEDRGRRAM